jgi:NDP-sugar pyrophosphorylase family protein
MTTTHRWGRKAKAILMKGKCNLKGVKMDHDLPTVIATVGGAGTRLYPLTLTQPKPLISILNYPVLMRMLEILAHQGCRDFIIGSKGAENTTRLKEVFRYGEAFSKRLELDPEAMFRYQPNYEDRGNADAVRYCMGYYNINKDVLVVGGDNIVDIELEEVIEYHKSNGALLTVVLKQLGEEDISQYGVAEITGEGRITRFVEKPKKEEAPSRLINTAIYLFSPGITEVFKNMGDKVKDIGGDVIPFLTENGYPVYGYLCKGYWADVGTPGSFLNTTQDILRQKVANIKFKEENKYRENVWIHPTTQKRIKNRIDEEEIQIGDYVLIGGDCEIGNGVRIESSCIGDNCIIEDDTVITGSVIMDFTNIGKGVHLNKCIIGGYAKIGDNSTIDADLSVDVAGENPDLTPVIGESVTLTEGAVIGPRKRVAPVYEGHKILSTERFIELGYDKNNVYFIEK